MNGQVSGPRTRRILVAGLRRCILAESHVAALALLGTRDGRRSRGTFAKTVTVDHISEQAAAPLRIRALNRHRSRRRHAALQNEGLERACIGIGCGYIVAAATEFRIFVVGGFDPAVWRFEHAVRVGVGAASTRSAVLRTIRIRAARCIVDPDIGVADHAGLASRAGRHHAVAEMAGNARVVISLGVVVVIVSGQLAATRATRAARTSTVRLDHATIQPARRRMAAQAKITDTGIILVGYIQRREEQRIAHRVGHH